MDSTPSIPAAAIVVAFVHRPERGGRKLVATEVMLAVVGTTGSPTESHIPLGPEGCPSAHSSQNSLREWTESIERILNSSPGPPPRNHPEPMRIWNIV